MKVKITKQFKYYPNVQTLITCDPGEHDIPAEFVQIAKDGGFTKAIKAAPKNKADQPTSNKSK